MEPRQHVLAAVIQSEGRYLVCQRPPHKRHGTLWEFPGGKLETGETLEDAARRELWEELGVELGLLGTVLLTVSEPGSPFDISFVGASIHGEPRAIEHSALAWVLRESLSEYQLAPSDRVFLDYLLRSEK